MGKSKTVSNMAVGAAVAICLSTVQVAQAAGAARHLPRHRRRPRPLGVALPPVLAHACGHVPRSGRGLNVV